MVCGGGNVANVCGTGSCTSESDVELCSRYAATCGALTVSNRCGTLSTASCGNCIAPKTCRANNQCVVTACQESNPAFCARLGKNCGAVSGTDICGQTRTAECGQCAATEICTSNVCTDTVGPSDAGSCVAESNPAFCLRLGKDCGSVTNLDNCGQQRTAACGTCTAPDTCGGAGVLNLCGNGSCQAETDKQFCARLGKNCGSVTDFDNCDMTRTATCGTCISPQVCTASVCSCTAETDPAFCTRLGKTCGTVTEADNCAVSRTVSCGTCTAPATCAQNVCACIPESNADLCTRAGKDCGVLTFTDNCGTARSLTCGGCIAPKTCGGGGTANRCGCFEPDQSFCTRLDKDCGSVTAVDKCGISRTANCGTCDARHTCPSSHVCTCPATRPAPAETANWPAIPASPSNGAYTSTTETVLDEQTCLIWQRDSSPSMNMPTAVPYCADLTLAGNTDWRLPTLAELESLLSHAHTPMINPIAFPNTQKGSYWSGSVNPAATLNWYLSFVNGNSALTDGATHKFYVRCVR
jgi:hypothetical protein